MNAHAELFGELVFQSIVLGMLALIAFAMAFKGAVSVRASVCLVWLAAAAMVFGIYRAMHSFNPLLRDTLVVWAALSFVVFAVCSSVWIRERNGESRPLRTQQVTDLFTSKYVNSYPDRDNERHGQPLTQ
jgi:hypothetical protein